MFFINATVQIFHLVKDEICPIQLGFTSLKTTFHLSPLEMSVPSLSKTFIICIIFIHT